MTDPALMRGDGWVRCAMCGALHVAPFPGLYVDAQGVRWDVCAKCAEDEIRAGEAHDRGG